MFAINWGCRLAWIATCCTLSLFVGTLTCIAGDLDRPWLAPRWNGAVQGIRTSLLRPVVVRGVWRGYRIAPIDCDHLRFRVKEYGALVAEVRLAVEQVAPDGSFGALDIDISRLLGRTLASIENYSASMGEIAAVIPKLSSEPQWIVVSFNNTVEVAVLRGAQADGATFQMIGNELHIRVIVPIEVACRPGPIDVYMISACMANEVTSTSHCPIADDSWQTIIVPAPGLTIRRQWP